MAVRPRVAVPKGGGPSMGATTRRHMTWFPSPILYVTRESELGNTPNTP